MEAFTNIYCDAGRKYLPVPRSLGPLLMIIAPYLFPLPFVVV